MNINKKLRDAAGYNPTKESRQLSIFDLCKMIDDQSLSLPLYQRDLSWTTEKCISLLNYQLLGKAPVSPISINVINDASNSVPQVSFITREIIESYERGQYSVVDGQQRLTTNYKAYSDDESFKDIVLDLGVGEFVRRKEVLRTNQIPVGCLMNRDDTVLFDFVNSHKAFSQDPNTLNLLLQIKNKIKNYNYTINSAKDLSEDEQIQWFEVLNNAGSRVTVIQMRFSKLKAHGIDIYTQYTNVYKDTVIDSGYEAFFTPYTTNVSFPIAALNPAYEVLVSQGRHQNNFAPIPSDTKENQLCNLKPSVLSECFEITLKSLEHALTFINDNDLKRPDRIDYINYLVGYFVFHEYPLSKEQAEKLIEWYNNVSFTNKSNTKRREIYSQLLNL